MEHIIHLLIGFIVLSFLLKTGFYPRWGIWLSALVYTVFPYLYRSMGYGTIANRDKLFCWPLPHTY